MRFACVIKFIWATTIGIFGVLLLLFANIVSPSIFKNQKEYVNELLFRVYSHVELFGETNKTVMKSV